MELERYVHANDRIPMSIALGAKKPISSHTVQFSQAIGVCVRHTFSICYLRWADVRREYIEVVKGDVQVRAIHNSFSFETYLSNQANVWCFVMRSAILCLISTIKQ